MKKHQPTDPIKVAQPRSPNPFKPYVPAPHPFIKRLEEFRAIKSLWTPGVAGGDK